MIHINTWSNIAKHWHIFEDLGTARSDLDGLRHFLASRLLVVGAGQGALVDFAEKAGIVTTGVDYCATMVELARQRRNKCIVHGDARALPFEDGAFSSLLVASGVLHSDDVELPLIFSECMRVTSRSSCIILAFPYIHWGTAGGMTWSQQIDSWRDAGLFEENMLRSSQISVKTMQPIRVLVKQLMCEGVEPEKYLRECVDFQQSYFSESLIYQVLRRCGLQVVYAATSHCGFVLHAVCRRKAAA